MNRNIDPARSRSVPVRLPQVGARGYAVVIGPNEGLNEDRSGSIDISCAMGVSSAMPFWRQRWTTWAYLSSFMHCIRGAETPLSWQWRLR
ncbi:hypothetical protein ACFPPA_00100 [Rhodanobacter ginsengisoli]|uniref:Uncharacterized protein n=1 Tax=Rhodanobacter ginsengisoli TaxID=418646 RepID=A0ABW0QHJ4_9GAMM